MPLFQTTEGFVNLFTYIANTWLKSVDFQELHCLGFQCSLGGGGLFLHMFEGSAANI